MLNIAEMVQLPAETIEQLTSQSKGKADSLAEARNVIADQFAGQKRISLDTVLRSLDRQVAEYRAGSDAAYWTPEGQAAARAAKEMEAASQGQVPTETPDATETPAETPAPEADKPASATRGGRAR
jgi:hypothetical protein